MWMYVCVCCGNFCIFEYLMCLLCMRHMPSTSLSHKTISMNCVNNNFVEMSNSIFSFQCNSHLQNWFTQLNTFVFFFSFFLVPVHNKHVATKRHTHAVIILNSFHKFNFFFLSLSLSLDSHSFRKVLKVERRKKFIVNRKLNERVFPMPVKEEERIWRKLNPTVIRESNQVTLFWHIGIVEVYMEVYYILHWAHRKKKLQYAYVFV